MQNISQKRLSSYVLLLTSPFFLLALVNGFYNPGLIDLSLVGFWIVEAVHYLFLPLAILLVLYRSAGVNPRDYGLVAADKMFPLWKMAGAGVFIGVLLLIAYNSTWRIVYYNFGGDDQLFSYGQIVPEGIWRLPVVLYLALTAGIVEEVMYRGLPWFVISNIGTGATYKLIYVLLSSIVFSAVHWEQGLAGLTASFIFGLIAALTYLKLKNLWPLIFAHSLIDIYYFWY